MNKFAISLLAAALLLACTKEENQNEGGTTVPPSTTEHTSDFQINYVTVQKRSSKRGVCSHMTTSPETVLPALAEGCNWYYTWGADRPADTIMELMRQYDMYFLPMMWGRGQYRTDTIDQYLKDMPETPYLLAFNEPNLTDQANMTPSAAAALWPEVRTVAQANNAKLISPALNYGTLPGYNDPVKWMDEFLAQPEVSLDDIYGIALHCYMNNINGIRNLIHSFAKYNKPIFLTEFCSANGNITNNVSTQSTFMSDVLTYLEAEPLIEGYSWFMDRASGSWSAIALVEGGYTNSKLTDLGIQYVNCSSFDAETFYSIRQPIPAEHYVSNSLYESIAANGNVTAAPKVRKTTDKTGILELGEFYTPGAWTEYNLNIPAAGKYAIAIRYKASMDSQYSLSAAGTTLGNYLLPQSEEWTTYWLENIELPAGKFRLRLTCSATSRADFNWFYID